MKRIRRILCFVLLAAMALSLAACGGSKKTDAIDNAPAEVPDVVNNVPVAEENSVGATEAPASSDGVSSSGAVVPPADAQFPPNAEKATPEDLKAIAESFIGRDVQELYDAIGYPAGSKYAASCLGPGEDGELSYEGFTVYTYKEGGTEEVRVVL